MPIRNISSLLFFLILLLPSSPAHALKLKEISEGLKKFVRAVDIYREYCFNGGTGAGYLNCDKEAVNLANLQESFTSVIEDEVTGICVQGETVGLLQKDLQTFILDNNHVLEERPECLKPPVPVWCRSTLSILDFLRQDQVINEIINRASAFLVKTEGMVPAINTGRRRSSVNIPSVGEVRRSSAGQDKNRDLERLMAHNMDQFAEEASGKKSKKEEYNSIIKNLNELLGANTIGAIIRRHSQLEEFVIKSPNPSSPNEEIITQYYNRLPEIKENVPIEEVQGSQGEWKKEFHRLNNQEEMLLLKFKVNNFYTTLKSMEGKDKKEILQIKSQLGQKMVDASICRGVIRNKMLVMVRPVNPAALPLMADGVDTKNLHIKGKSATSGFMDGYIPANAGLSKLMELPDGPDKKEKILKFQLEINKSIAEGTVVSVPLRKFIEEGHFKVAVIRKGEEMYVDEDKVLPDDILLKVLAYPGGHYITADADLFAVASQSPLEHVPVANSTDRGKMYQHEERIMSDINSEFNNLLRKRKHLMDEEKSNFTGRTLVHHGAEVNNPNSTISDVDFPIRAYSPPDCAVYDIGKAGEGEKESSMRQLKEYFNKKRAEGYGLWPNPNWNWVPYDKFNVPIHIDWKGGNEQEREKLKGTIDHWGLWRQRVRPLFTV